MSIVHPTSRVSISWWARAGAIGFVAVAAVGVADRFIAPARAQVEPVTEVVSQTDAGEPLGAPPANTAPAISDDADIVAFVTVEDDGVQRVAVRDRSAATTQFVAESASSHPAVSGDGCVISYTVEVSPPVGDATIAPSVELRALDRCTAPAGPFPEGVVVHTLDVPTAMARPGVSADGSVILWSTGVDVVRFVRLPVGKGDGYTIDEEFDPLADAPVPADAVTGPGVDVSADGTVVAFVAGPGVDAYAPSPPDVYVWSADPADGASPVELASIPSANPPVAPPEAGSTAPVLSGDGTLVLFESSDTDLSANAGDSATVTPFVVMYERGVGSAVLEADARRPAISVDGHHAVYDNAGAVQSIRWSEGVPFGSVARDVVAGESMSGPVVSSNGRSVVFDSAAGAELTDDARFHTGTHVWLRFQTQELSGEDVDLGSVEVPGGLAGTATITNSGVAGFPIESIVVDAPFAQVATDCAGVLQPGQSCTVDVSVDVDDEGPLDGLVRVTGGTPPAEFDVALTATGVPPSTTTSTSTTSTSTTSSTTTTTIRATPPTRPPVVITRPPRPPTVPTATTPRPTTPPTTTSTTTPLPVVFNPATFDFAPTIIDAGRRTAAIDLFNPALEPVTVVAVRMEPADNSGFTADGTACVSQQLVTGGACAVSVEFAPTAEGSLSATVVADLSDGTTASLAVTGFGAPPPTLTVTPDVAANGQVVAIEGGGFPAGAAVDLSWDDGRVRRALVIDGVGGFVETMAVLPNTAGGPSEVIVAGQIDLFGDVTAELLVSESGSRSAVALFSRLGASVAR